MKKLNKFVSMLLVVVMIFAMSINAFAATNGTATIQVLYYGEPILDENPVSFNVTANMTAKDALDLYYDVLANTWKEVENFNPNPAFGDTAYVVESIFGQGSEAVGSASGITAQFWSSQYPGYGIKSSELVNGKMLYHYIYVGNDWTFSVNENRPLDPVYKDEYGNFYELYMDQYVIQPGDRLVISFDQVIEEWDSNDYWLTA